GRAAGQREVAGDLGQFAHGLGPVHPVQPLLQFVLVDAALGERLADPRGAVLPVHVRGAEAVRLHGGVPRFWVRGQRDQGNFFSPGARVLTLTEPKITVPVRRTVGASTGTAESAFLRLTSPKIGVVRLTTRTPGGSVSFSSPKVTAHWMTTSRWVSTASRRSSDTEPNSAEALVRGSTSQRPLRSAEANTATMFSDPSEEAGSSAAEEAAGAAPRSAVIGSNSPSVLAA